MTKFDIIQRAISVSDELSAEAQLRLIKAVSAYLGGEDVADLQGAENLIFKVLKFDMDMVIQEEQTTTQKRANAGRKSGESRRAKKGDERTSNTCSLFAEEEKKNNNKNNIINNNQENKTSSSFSSSPTPSSFPSSSSEQLVNDILEGKDLDCEDKAYYEFFFWSNFKEPKEEVRRFKNWNRKRKWRTAVGSMDTLEDRMMAASEWKPNVEGMRCSPKLLSTWRACYDIIKTVDQVAAEDMIYVFRVEVENGVNVVYISQRSHDAIVNCPEALRVWKASDVKKVVRIENQE